jgi:DNA-binding LytR/AlgR family response regulator
MTQRQHPATGTTPPDAGAPVVTALLADDEDLPRSELRRMLATHWPALQVVAECEHGPAALQALTALQPDVAFLDIRMPGLSGLEVARAAASGRCHVVFTTAYDSHAVEAFDAGALDYLLKPVAAERLAQAVARLQQRLASRQPAPQVDELLRHLAAARLLAPAQAAVRPAPLRWVSASVGDTIKLFAVDEILFFQSDEKYTRVVSASDEAHVRKPLREFADALDPELFWQVHRGTVVRASAIARAQRDELGHITLHLRGHAEKLAVSQAYAWRFKPM